MARPKYPTARPRPKLRWKLPSRTPNSSSALAGLAEHEQAALRGAFFDGNTYEELAARMSVPLGTMKSWIRRAMVKLKVCLET